MLECNVIIVLIALRIGVMKAYAISDLLCQCVTNSLYIGSSSSCAKIPYLDYIYYLWMGGGFERQLF